MAPPSAPVADWSGFYIGGFAGGATTGNATTSDPCLVGAVCSPVGTYNAVAPVSHGLGSSAIGGGTIGWNWQSSQFVFGFENEIGYIRLRGSAVINPLGSGDTSANATIGDWYDAYTTRAGIVWNQVLLYAKGGGVSAGYSSGVVDTTPPVTINTTTTKILSGWAVGGGLEYAMTPNWSVKAEYLYLGLAATVNQCAQVGGFPAGTIDCDFTKTNNINTFKVGVNYHFH